ncbi:hypothetical protein [Peribacillus frigoritolerans]|uniref:hypothetical protein n=1 Tax=Peribacillus frigoritolerans TaxID=450367 RepID=UPI002EA992B0|nr:hypothetical protein [Peribacillus frigoritolerans]
MTNEITNFEIIPSDYSPQKIDSSIAALNQPLANMLTKIGLPTENVLSPIEERRKVIFALESTLDILPLDARQKSFYLSKFTVAVTVGLFDGALTYLWDETIKAVRDLVARFDLQYFFNIAETLSPRYKNLHVIEDMPAVSEHDLLEICRRIGLINDINFKRLEHVNYLRNHASSAHPNENDISGIEMLSLLEHCLKYAINAVPDHSVIQIKTLLENVRINTIPASDCELIGQDFSKHPQERIDDFVTSIFGLYIDPRQKQNVKTNIENLAPYVWVSSSEETKYVIGSKFGVYRKNGDSDRKEATQKFLELVEGLTYKDEDSLSAELIEKLQNLRTVHFEFNNFYTESPHAKSISDSMPTGRIPDAARKLFVKVISICYAGNGKGYREGVDENALPYYIAFIESFTVREVVEFIYLFEDNEFVYDIDKTKSDVRLRKLASYLKTKTSDVHINKTLDLIINFPTKTLHKIWGDTRFQETLKFVKKV